MPPRISESINIRQSCELTACCTGRGGYGVERYVSMVEGMMMARRASDTIKGLKHGEVNSMQKRVIDRACRMKCQDKDDM